MLASPQAWRPLLRGILDPPLVGTVQTAFALKLSFSLKVKLCCVFLLNEFWCNVQNIFDELICLCYRFVQEFSADDVDEDFVYLEISTKNTTKCDGVLDLLFTKPPKSDTCPSNRRTLDSCELMDGLRLDTSCIVRCPCPQNCEKLIKVTASSHTEPWILCPVTLA